jgi:hypothetical protein
VIRGLIIFINRIVGYIDLRGFHAPLTGILNSFINRSLGYIDLWGFMPH